MNRLEALLTNNPNESDVQNFFERNVKALTGSIYLLGDGAIRKFPLGTDHVTDFAYVNPTSGACFIWLVELESPEKQIFTSKDKFTEPFNHGLQQVRDWMSWCSRNQLALRDQLEPLRRQNGSSIMSYVARGMLIYGRRAEISNSRRQERWQGLIDSNPYIQIRTYDGIAQEADDFLSNPHDFGDPKCLVYRERNYEILA